MESNEVTDTQSDRAQSNMTSAKIEYEKQTKTNCFWNMEE